MSKFYTLGFLFLSLALVLSYQNCGSEKKAISNPSFSGSLKTVYGTPARINGQVDLLKDKPLDGCEILLIGIDPSTGQKAVFIPVGLPNEYYKDNLEVEIEGELNPEMVTTCMAGKIIKVTSVKPRN